MSIRDVGVQHVLLTRVNVSRGFGHGDGRAVTPAWLDRQLQLFEGLAIPSVRSQTSQDFTWLLIASEDTPEPYRRRIQSYGDERTVVCFVGDYSATIPAELVMRHLQPGTTRLLTSRVDTDDVLDERYLQRVRSESLEVQNGFLNWDRGYIYDLQRSRLYSRTHRSNMFINLMEPVTTGVAPVTAMGVIHTQAAATRPVTAIDDDRMWLQVMHDQNWMSSMEHFRPAAARGLRTFVAPMLDDGRSRSRRAEVFDLIGWQLARSARRLRRVAGRGRSA